MIRVSHQPAAAVTGGAAFTGGQGELLRYLQGLDLQYARMAQDDAQQMRALQFQAAQQQSGQQARMLDSLLGMNFSAQRDMWQAQQRQAEMAAERGFMEKRDAALGDRRMAEMTAGHGMDMERMEAEWAARNRMALSEMDAKALADGSAVYDPAASARLAELDRAEQELMTEPKFDARQRQEGLARVQRERQAIRPRYLRPDERQPSMDEEFQTRVLSRPEGVFMRQPDGEWTFQPNKNEDPNTLRMEQIGKLNESRAKAISSYIEAQVKIRTAITKVPGPPTVDIDPKTGQETQVPGAEMSVPAFTPKEAEAMLAPIRGDIDNFTAQIEQLKAETHGVADEAKGIFGQLDVAGQTMTNAHGGTYGEVGAGILNPVTQQNAPPRMGGQLPMLPPEQAQQPPMAAPQQQAQANPFAGMDDKSLKAFHDQALAAGDRAVAYAAHTEMQRRQNPKTPEEAMARSNAQLPPDQQAPKGFAFPNGDQTKAPLPVFKTPEQLRAAIKAGKLKPGQHFIDGNTGKTIELAQQ